MGKSNTISDSQRVLNAQLHQSRGDFGNRANAGGVARNLPKALKRMAKLKVCNSFLDYGCGKGGLVEALQNDEGLNIPILGYDPAIKEYSKYPKDSFDILSCLDVLEHIELNTIDVLLDEIKLLTRNFCFIVVDLQPAVKTLADGRNAHILLAPKDWWIQKFNSRFDALISFPLRHKSGHDQKIVIIASNKMHLIKYMMAFADTLDIFTFPLKGGTLANVKPI